jgi:HAD superfamily hydrolase (TIGR01549 family)
MITKNQKTKDLLQFINSEQLDSFSHGVFDLDQTLYDYETCNQNGVSSVVNFIEKNFNIDKKIALNAYLKARKSINQELKNTSSMHSRFLYLKQMCKILSIKDSTTNTLQFYDLYWISFFEKIKLFDWVIPVFNELERKNIVIIIATDFNARLQFLKIKKLKINDYITEIITSQEVGIEKPSQQFAEKVLNFTNTNYEKIFCVGDNPKKDIFLSNYGIKTFII